MSTRKVSDLPALLPAQLKQDQFDNSFLEVSYLSTSDSSEYKKYASMRMVVKDFEDVVATNVLNVNKIPGSKYFPDGIEVGTSAYIEKSLSVQNKVVLTGDLSVNAGVESPKTNTYISNRNNTIVGIVNNTLSAPNIDIRSNNIIGIRSNNIVDIDANTLRIRSYSNDASTGEPYLRVEFSPGADKGMYVHSNMSVDNPIVIAASKEKIMQNAKNAATVAMITELSNKITAGNQQLGTMAYCNHFIGTALPATLSANTFYFIYK